MVVVGGWYMPLVYALHYGLPRGDHQGKLVNRSCLAQECLVSIIWLAEPVMVGLTILQCSVHEYSHSPTAC